MGQGFQRKIDTIVDSIVNSEKENNQKIDEVDISENIKKAIADLNDVGKLLILEDLMVEAGSKPSTLLTLDGKISTEKLNKVVISKVKAAEREGIDLRTNQSIIKDNKNLVAKGILTFSVIETMINNYDNLSSQQKDSLLDNYKNLSEKQKEDLINAVFESYDRTVERYRNEMSEEEIEQDKKIKEERSALEKLDKAIKNKDSSELSEEEIEEFVSRGILKIGADGTYDWEATTKEFKDAKVKIAQESSKFEKNIKLKRLQHLVAISKTEGGMERLKDAGDVEKLEKLKDEFPDEYEEYVKKDFGIPDKADSQQLNNKEVNGEMPKGKLTENYNSMTAEEICQNTGMNMTDLFGLGSNNEVLQEDVDVGVSQEEVDMEAVKAELSAIPKALVGIDASTQDIAEGMQGYKQLIDNLDTKEIEGKSNEDVLKVLAGKVSEIVLTGNANLILEMMTQIGFSGLKNSEMKIRPILTTVKSEFVQMIDDVSKEEYIEKARNEMLAKEPIKDAEAEPGMKSFMVDLRVATKERNDLTNQIIGKDEKQDSITGTSDSDATQGSTSSGKISFQNMMNTVQNVRMAEIKNVQDLMINIAKENTEMLQEQDELIQDEEQDIV